MIISQFVTTTGSQYEFTVTKINSNNYTLTITKDQEIVRTAVERTKHEIMAIAVKLAYRLGKLEK